MLVSQIPSGLSSSRAEALCVTVTTPNEWQISVHQYLPSSSCTNRLKKKCVAMIVRVFNFSNSTSSSCCQTTLSSSFEFWFEVRTSEHCKDSQHRQAVDYTHKFTDSTMYTYSILCSKMFSYSSFLSYALIYICLQPGYARRN